MKSSTDAGAVGPPDGDPAETALADAAGLAQWVGARDDVSATGGPVAPRRGQISWAMFEMVCWRWWMDLMRNFPLRILSRM